MLFESLVCTAIAVYFEARGEPSEGQLAVAHVIQNRIEDARYPDNACAVVKQGYYWQGHPIRDKCQFSFWCDGKSDDPKNNQAFYNSLYISFLSTIREDVTGGATHYHAIDIYPEWAFYGEPTKRIDKHLFYKGVK